jgi:hypothetical protein
MQYRTSVSRMSEAGFRATFGEMPKPSTPASRHHPIVHIKVNTRQQDISPEEKRGFPARDSDNTVSARELVDLDAMRLDLVTSDGNGVRNSSRNGQAV